uniref:Stromal cell derived factor 2 n=1 Tax=Sphenodon punctatus TaxID=8508 RepID=A0A8D0GM30_SPHPU
MVWGERPAPQRAPLGQRVGLSRNVFRKARRAPPVWQGARAGTSRRRPGLEHQKGTGRSPVVDSWIKYTLSSDTAGLNEPPLSHSNKAKANRSLHLLTQVVIPQLASPLVCSASHGTESGWVALTDFWFSVGSGSGQQSVTGVTAVDDSNSYWRVRGQSSTVCERGTPVKCGQAIRLTHVNTGRNLHSHHFTSPLSGNQEVSAFGEDGEGDYLDDWLVLCSGSYWGRDSEVRFKHMSTAVLLSVTGEQYGRPIHGQKEVHGMTSSSQHSYWRAMEGIFMKPSELLKMDPYHSEL